MSSYRQKSLNAYSCTNCLGVEIVRSGNLRVWVFFPLLVHMMSLIGCWRVMMLLVNSEFGSLEVHVDTLFFLSWCGMGD